MSAARDTYSILRTDNPLRISIPEYNYRSGKRKSALFQGPGWYIPSEIRWESYNEHHELPRLTRRDAVEMQCEEDFINFLNKRYVPNSKFLHTDNHLSKTQKLLHTFRLHHPVQNGMDIRE
ncbi:hypothetical protein CLF_110240 [Clonorchis sinensis]|uniref:Uncharacterized protein n=1 Tax=Clonorchis sinensis TaxID=79923 RepID=G7YKG0_CLOSI|nr:hypothetical protein CLF_110240 [Clonorchis sinensis]